MCTWPGTDGSFRMFKSVLSQHVSGFCFQRMIGAVYLLLAPSFFLTYFLLLSVLWRLAPWNRLWCSAAWADWCSYGSQCYQVKTVSLCIKIRQRSLSDLHASSFPTCELSTQLQGVERMPATCWCLTPPPSLPPSVSVCHMCFCSCTHNAFRCHKGIYSAFLQHICRIEMPNAALFLFCFDVLTSPYSSGLGKRFWKSKAICSLGRVSFSFYSTDALLWYCLDHSTQINCMHTNRK